MKTSNKKKLIVIPLVIVLALVVLRLALQPVLLGYINEKLGTLSPEITGHVGGLDLALIRGAAGLDDVTMKLKKTGTEFLNVKKVDVSLAWRELVKGNLMADAEIDGVNFTLDERLPKALKTLVPDKKDKNAPKTQPPIRISRVDWKDVNIILPTDKAYTNQGPFRLSHIRGRITNLFGSSETPRSFFYTLGQGSGTSTFKAIGSANLKADPVEWDVDAQMQGFDLTAMNRFLLKKVPLTFTHGTFDLYSEVKSEEGKIRGYVKPFVTDLDFIRTNENFKGAKHWLIEVAGAVGNWVLEANRDKTMATKVPFTYDGKHFAVDTRKAVGNVIKHGFDQELSPGVDANLHMQAQEAKKEAKETDRENKVKEKKVKEEKEEKR